MAANGPQARARAAYHTRGKFRAALAGDLLKSAINRQPIERTDGRMGLLAFRKRRRTGLAARTRRGRRRRGARGAGEDTCYYVAAPDGSVAIAAAEITSASQGNSPGDLPENVASWVTAHGRELGAENVELALQAAERVGGDESELAELWDDADEPEWRESLGELSERLRAALR
jgi:hypothetical protein